MERRTGCLRLGLALICLTACYHLYAWARDNRYRHWTLDPGSVSFARPVVDRHGYVFKVFDDKVLAIDGQSGAAVWTFAVPGKDERFDEGLVCSDGLLFAASFEAGYAKRLYALNAATGKVMWSTNRFGGRPWSAARGTVLVGTTQVTAADAATGRVRWVFVPPNRPAKDDKRRITCLASDGMSAVVGIVRTSTKLYGLDATTGKVRWSVDTGGGITIAGARPGRVVVGQSHGTIYAVDALSGRRIWGFLCRNTDAAPQAEVVLGTIYAATDGGMVYSLRADDGHRNWERKLDHGCGSAPALASDGVLYVGTDGNRVWALDAAAGHVEACLSFGWLTRSFPYGDSVTPVAGLDGMVYADSTDGKLYALKAPK